LKAIKLNSDICSYHHEQQAVVYVSDDKKTYLLADELFFVFNFLSHLDSEYEQLSFESVFQRINNYYIVDKETLMLLMNELASANIVMME
jgi:hypothetical protein